MPRRSRITVAEVPVHIIQRGNNRGACFLADTDDELHLAHLQALAAKFACAVHATCLMTHHVHLLLTPQAADRLAGADIDRAPRGYDKASDHTPVWCEIAP